MIKARDIKPRKGQRKMETTETMPAESADKFHCSCGGNFTDVTLRHGKNHRATALCDRCGAFWYVKGGGNTWERYSKGDS